jgi:hypothetical protein
MTQEIKPTYVTFEQAKWLKEKGFDIPCQFLYVDGDYRIDFEKEGELFDGEYPSTQKPIDWCLAPEQWQVVEWLRVNHNLYVSPYPYYVKWSWEVLQIDTTKKYHYITSLRNGRTENPDNFNSPQEAYSAAFDYVLNNLI